MQAESTQSNHNHVVAPHEMTIYSAVENKDVLMKHLASEGDLEIDLSEISELDSTGLQLLILLKREAKLKNKAISFVGHNEVVLEVFELFNIASFFGDPMLISSAAKKGDKK